VGLPHLYKHVPRAPEGHRFLADRHGIRAIPPRHQARHQTLENHNTAAAAADVLCRRRRRKTSDKPCRRDLHIAAALTQSKNQNPSQQILPPRSHIAAALKNRDKPKTLARQKLAAAIPTSPPPSTTDNKPKNPRHNQRNPAAAISFSPPPSTRNPRARWLPRRRRSWQLSLLLLDRRHRRS
jgi:hypothetical protein